MTNTLTEVEKADLYAHIAMIEGILRNAEVCDNAVPHIYIYVS